MKIKILIFALALAMPVLGQVPGGPGGGSSGSGNGSVSNNATLTSGAVLIGGGNGLAKVGVVTAAQTFSNNITIDAAHQLLGNASTASFASSATSASTANSANTATYVTTSPITNQLYASNVVGVAGGQLLVTNLAVSGTGSNWLAGPTLLSGDVNATNSVYVYTGGTIISNALGTATISSGLFTSTNTQNGGAAWKSPTNLPTANQVIAATSTSGDTKWANAGGAIYNYQASQLFNPNGTTRYSSFQYVGGDQGSVGACYMKADRAIVLTNFAVSMVSGSLYNAGTNAYLSIGTNVPSSVANGPGSVPTDSGMSMLWQAGAHNSTNTGTASLALAAGTYFCVIESGTNQQGLNKVVNLSINAIPQ